MKKKIQIFGYGSLINSYSRKYTGKGYIGSAIPVELSTKAGYKRIWVCKKSKYGNKSFLGFCCYFLGLHCICHSTIYVVGENT